MPNTLSSSSRLSDLASPDLPPELEAHLSAAETAAFKTLAAVQAGQAGPLKALSRQLQEVLTPRVPQGAKLIRIRHIASEFGSLFSTQSACASGCSHCCHINVAVPRSEAKLIAKATGRPLTEPLEHKTIESVQISPDTFCGQACTFLVAGQCSIYKQRPLVCRTLVNMDNVDTLCRLVPGVQVPVPYLNTTEIQSYFVYLTQTEQFADIREWFPPGATSRP